MLLWATERCLSGSKRRYLRDMAKILPKANVVPTKVSANRSNPLRMEEHPGIALGKQGAEPKPEVFCVCECFCPGRSRSRTLDACNYCPANPKEVSVSPENVPPTAGLLSRLFQSLRR